MAYFSNGTAGLLYEEWNCNKCAHYGTDESYCSILAAHAAYQGDSGAQKVLDMLIPDSDEPHVIADECTMFIPKLGHFTHDDVLSILHEIHSNIAPKGCEEYSLYGNEQRLKQDGIQHVITRFERLQREYKETQETK